MIETSLIKYLLRVFDKHFVFSNESFKHFTTWTK